MTKPQRILVVEDDDAIRRGLVDALEAERYGVVEAADGEAGLQSALVEPLDLVLLDLMLPGRDGLEILRDLRQARPVLPVIILTALGREEDRVKGLRLGADDYVVKPFSVRELLARVEAVLRRTPERPLAVKEIRIPGGLVDLSRNEIRFDDGRTCGLGQRETELLRYLAANPGRPISRDEILLRVWGVNPRGIETRTVDMHVARLREKLRDDAARPKLLLTVRGKGYLFQPEGTPS